MITITSETTQLLTQLVEVGVLSVDAVGSLHHTEPHQLFAILKHRFMLNDAQLIDACQGLANLSIKTASDLVIDPTVWSKISKEQCAGLFPIYWDNTEIAVATDNPFHDGIIQLHTQWQRPIHRFLVTPADLQKLWSRSTSTNEPLTALHHMINHALSVSASDIHLYKQELDTVMMLRIDGKLVHQQTLTGQDERQLASLIKFHGELDISKINQPQDGRIRHLWQGVSVDVRVSSLPSAYGEDYVLRLFNTHHKRDRLEDLSFTESALSLVSQMISHRHGLILVTGPTGSGKTTTLYTLLNHLKKDKTKSIITLEDTIENILTGIRQSQINPGAGYTFIQGLRAILRQDPDIIMIGEIRDAETAKIALEAAYTGHLVLSTLHTANCESTLLRLQSFDLDPFLLGHSLKGVISQFLTPQRCAKCNQAGCADCHDSGFKGRIAIHEMLSIQTPLALKTQDDFKTLMSQNQYYPFYQDINQKINDGKVSRDKWAG